MQQQLLATATIFGRIPRQFIDFAACESRDPRCPGPVSC